MVLKSRGKRCCTSSCPDRVRRIFQGAGMYVAKCAAMVFGAATLVSAWGCNTGPNAPPTPEATIIEFSRALSQGDLEQAYALMSSSYRKRVSFERFKQQLEENPEETMEISNALSHIRGPAEQEAVMHFRDDGELRLKRDGEHWTITTNVVDFYDQSTPRAALRTFVRAMERKRYDVVMRLVPSADKEGISAQRMEEAWSGEGREEVERLLSNLTDHLDAPIEIIGNHATMPYGENMRVQFVREGTAWKIEDPE